MAESDLTEKNTSDPKEANFPSYRDEIQKEDDAQRRCFNYYIRVIILGIVAAIFVPPFLPQVDSRISNTPKLAEVKSELEANDQEIGDLKTSIPDVIMKKVSEDQARIFPPGQVTRRLGTLSCGSDYIITKAGYEDVNFSGEFKAATRSDEVIVSGPDGMLIASVDAGKNWINLKDQLLEKYNFTYRVINKGPLLSNNQAVNLIVDHNNLLVSRSSILDWDIIKKVKSLSRLHCPSDIRNKICIQLKNSLIQRYQIDQHTWGEPINPPKSDDYHAHHMSLSPTGIAVLTGKNGYLAVSNEDYSEWIPDPKVRIPNINLRKAIFSTDKYGIVIGSNGHYLTTKDYGKSWTVKTFPENSKEKENLEIKTTTFHTPFFATLLREDGSLYTFNFEKEELKKSDLKVTNNKLIFSDKLFGATTGGEGYFYKSEKGGAKWKQVTTPVDPNANLREPVFNSKNFGVVSGDAGSLYLSFNGGKNWQILEIETKASLSKPAFSENGHGVMITAESNKFVITSDYGQSWDIQTVDDNSLSGLIFNSSNAVFVVNREGGIWRSFDISQLKRQDEALISALKDSTYRKESKTLDYLLAKKKILEDTKATIIKNEASAPSKTIERQFTRATIIALLIYLAHHFLTSYRYHMRQKASYEAIQKAIDLRKSSPNGFTIDTELVQLISALKPDTSYGNKKAPIISSTSVSLKSE